MPSLLSPVMAQVTGLDLQVAEGNVIFTRTISLAETNLSSARNVSYQMQESLGLALLSLPISLWGKRTTPN